MTAEIIQERYFYHLGCIPEWGLRYLDGKMLLYEFSTKGNFYFTNKMKNKLAAYRKYLYQIEDKFSSNAILVYVMDVENEKVKEFVEEVKPVGFPAYFTDYQTFKSVPVGQQFLAPIYIWGKDGSAYPLTKDDRPQAH